VSGRRVLHLAGERVAVLVCGELFSRQIEDTVRQSGAMAVAVMVHRDQGFRFNRAACRWCSNRPLRAIFMSSHVSRERAAKRWAMDGVYHTEREHRMDKMR